MIILLFMLALAAAGFSFIAGQGLGYRSGVNWSKRQHRELEIRRSADNHLRADALDRMDAEPYARVVYDELTNTEREISQ